MREVIVALPDEVFDQHPWDPDRVANEMRTLWLVEQVRERRMAWGKAARLAKVSQAAFLRLLGLHGVPVFDYDPGELEAELAAIP